MTPFMAAVRDVLDHSEPAWLLPLRTGADRRASSPTRPVAVAAEAHLQFRAQAEQLVSEANAVLREHGEIISLADECGPNELGFILGFRDRTIRVETVIAARRASSRVVIGDASRPLPTDEDQMRALVLSLLVDAPHR